VNIAEDLYRPEKQPKLQNQPPPRKSTNMAEQQMHQTTPKQIAIRQETPADFLGVYAIHAAAFGAENEAKLVDLLRESLDFIPELSLVATLENRLVGHILFSKIQIVDADQNQEESLALAPVAVCSEDQRQGIGGELIRAGLRRAKALHFKSVIVLGHARYYPKFGFEPAEKWRIKAPFEVPAEVFMALELVPDGLKNVHGTVVYPKEFEMV